MRKNKAQARPQIRTRLITTQSKSPSIQKLNIEFPDWSWSLRDQKDDVLVHVYRGNERTQMMYLTGLHYFTSPSKKKWSPIQVIININDGYSTYFAGATEKNPFDFIVKDNGSHCSSMVGKMKTLMTKYEDSYDETKLKVNKSGQAVACVRIG